MSLLIFIINIMMWFFYEVIWCWKSTEINDMKYLPSHGNQFEECESCGRRACCPGWIWIHHPRRNPSPIYSQVIHSRKLFQGNMLLDQTENLKMSLFQIITTQVFSIIHLISFNSFGYEPNKHLFYVTCLQIFPPVGKQGNPSPALPLPPSIPFNLE
jgi:hypothetical protein